MLERYFVRPQTWDRIRGSWIAPAIEGYVEWLTARSCARGTVYRRVPVVEEFGEFARRRGAAALDELPAHVEAFVEYRLAMRGQRCATELERRRVRHAARIPVEQMLRLALPEYSGTQRASKPLPFVSQVPRFFPFLREERGLQPSTIDQRAHYLRSFEGYLARIRLRDLADLTPLVITAFVTESADALAPKSVSDVVTTLRTFLRFLHRERRTDEDLSTAMELPIIYRDSKLPRSITWADVRRVLAAIDRRTASGRRDYAVIMLLVSYGLRAREVARLTLDDIDWRQGRLRVPDRKAGHSTSYPLSASVGTAIAEYLRDGRPACNDRHVFLRLPPPFGPMTIASISQRAKQCLRAAGVSVPRPGSHTFRHTCVQRLVDVGMPLETIGEYVGHRSPESTRVYGKVAVETLREVALGDGEAVL